MRRRSKEERVYITLSGCWCGLVSCPGSSRYSRTRTRSFSKMTLYLSGSVPVGSATCISFVAIGFVAPPRAPRAIVTGYSWWPEPRVFRAAGNSPKSEGPRCSRPRNCCLLHNRAGGLGSRGSGGRVCVPCVCSVERGGAAGLSEPRARGRSLCDPAWHLAGGRRFVLPGAGAPAHVRRALSDPVSDSRRVAGHELRPEPARAELLLGVVQRH